MSKQKDIEEAQTKPELYTVLGAVVCDNCGTKDNYRDVTTDQIDLIETEKDRICNNCNELMDCWAYGYWEKESNCT